MQWIPEWNGCEGHSITHRDQHYKWFIQTLLHSRHLVDSGEDHYKWDLWNYPGDEPIAWKLLNSWFFSELLPDSPKISTSSQCPWSFFFYSQGSTSVVFKFGPSIASPGHLFKSSLDLLDLKLRENGLGFLVLPSVPPTHPPPSTSDACSSLGTAMVLRFSRAHGLET